MGLTISFHSFQRFFPDYLSKRMSKIRLHPFFLYYNRREQWSISAILFIFYNMARFRVTTKHVKNSNGIRIEPGMSVEVVTQSMSNPVTTNGGQAVADAFYRIYGIDIKKAGCLNMIELDVDHLS